MLPTRKSVQRSSRQPDHTRTPLTIVKRRKLQWYGHVSRSSGLAKTIMQGTVKGGRKTGQTEEKVERQYQGMDRPGVRQVPEGSGERGIICGALTTLAVSRSGELRTQISKSHLVRTQSLNVLPLKPGVGQYIATHTTHLIQRPCYQRGSPCQDPGGNWTT